MVVALLVTSITPSLSLSVKVSRVLPKTCHDEGVVVANAELPAQALRIRAVHIEVVHPALVVFFLSVAKDLPCKGINFVLKLKA